MSLQLLANGRDRCWPIHSSHLAALECIKPSFSFLPPPLHTLSILQIQRLEQSVSKKGAFGNRQ